MKLNEQEQEIIRKVQNGDMDALGELFEKYKNISLKTVYLITGNLYTSEDIVQEAFIKCFYNVKSLRNIESFRSWFYKLLIRMAWEFNKKEKRAIPTEDVYEKADNKITELTQKEENLLIHSQINQLEIKQKTTVILYYFNDLSIKEIAKIMSCLEGTVKSRLYSARKTLKIKLKELNQEKECDSHEACKFI